MGEEETDFGAQVPREFALYAIVIVQDDIGLAGGFRVGFGRHGHGVRTHGDLESSHNLGLPTLHMDPLPSHVKLAHMSIIIPASTQNHGP